MEDKDISNRYMLMEIINQIKEMKNQLNSVEVNVSKSLENAKVEIRKEQDEKEFKMRNDLEEKLRKLERNVETIKEANSGNGLSNPCQYETPEEILKFENEMESCPKKFINNLTQFLHLNNVTSTYYVVVENHLIGNALKWYLFNKNDISSFDDFKYKFLKAFWGPNEKKKVRSYLESKRYTEGSGYNNRCSFFYEQYNRFCELINNNDHEIFDIVACQFGEEFKSIYLMNNVQNVEDFVNLLTSYEDLLEQCRSAGQMVLQYQSYGNHDYLDRSRNIGSSVESGSSNSVVCGLQHLEGRPGSSSLWATTGLGDVFVMDPVSIQNQQFDDNSYSRDLTYKHKAVPWRNVLSNGFTLDSCLNIICYIPEYCERFSINLESETDTRKAFHFNPRFDERVIVRNSMENDVWGKEERSGEFTLQTQTTVAIKILCQKDSFKVWIDGNVFTDFQHRMKPELICYATVAGGVHLQKIIYTSNKMICNGDTFWRQMGGHMAVVESCSSGVTWGISADNTPWLYTGGWGGTFLSGYEKSDYGVNSMKDMYCLHVYENQRWNPLTGFTPKGLPTDRPMWSDSTGHIKRSKESIRLLNMHWQWMSDWAVDFTTPGGVDVEGWQYATDFPASYHARKTITDYVRRRRWSRKCKLTILGPWQEIGNSKIISVSLQQSSAVDTICVWAVGIGGDALFRKGVSASNPLGENWEQVACDQPLECISCGYGNQVWAVCRKGYALWRFGITTSNPIGLSWDMVDNPKGAVLKKVSVAKWSVWALDSQGKIFVRHEVSPVFPEGSHWESLEFDENFEDVSAGGDEIWAVSTKGMLYHRVGVSKAFPAGLCWDPIINSNWKTVCCRGYVVKN